MAEATIELSGSGLPTSRCFCFIAGVLEFIAVKSFNVFWHVAWCYHLCAMLALAFLQFATHNRLFLNFIITSLGNRIQIQRFNLRLINWGHPFGRLGSFDHWVTNLLQNYFPLGLLSRSFPGIVVIGFLLRRAAGLARGDCTCRVALCARLLRTFSGTVLIFGGSRLHPGSSASARFWGSAVFIVTEILQEVVKLALI